jgi:class 3 adenylate cyclase
VDMSNVEQGTAYLPVGTVTFLLTDVEGSTFLWESAPDAMGASIRRHYQLLDAAITLHGGVRPVEQGEGDSVVAAFARASHALAAALDIQRAFCDESWPEGAALKLRIALHTAQAQLRDEVNYFGPAVNRCARLRAVAHGGQVVLSKTTRDLACDRLPDGAELADLGLHRLRDLGQPEHVFGLVHPDLPAEFPPLRSLGTLSTNLPAELTSFIGRSTELAELGELLGQVRLLTITGAGGCGKTRLARHAAAATLDGHLDGVWWVELARLEDAAFVPAAVIAAIGVRELPGQGPLGTLVAYLRARRALLILDNCEHVSAACAKLAEALLRGCPSLTVLATSRAPLGVPGETAWRVPSLSLPADDCRAYRAYRAPLEVLQESDAVRLFVDRATQVRPDFQLTLANAPGIAQICRELDVSRWPSSWPPRGCGCWRLRRSRTASAIGSSCSPAAAGWRCRVSGPCRPPSTGATSCSARASGRCCGGCRSSPAGGHWTPRSKCVPATALTAVPLWSCWPPWSTSPWSPG